MVQGDGASSDVSCSYVPWLSRSFAMSGDTKGEARGAKHVGTAKNTADLRQDREGTLPGLGGTQISKRWALGGGGLH